MKMCNYGKSRKFTPPFLKISILHSFVFFFCKFLKNLLVKACTVLFIFTFKFLHASLYTLYLRNPHQRKSGCLKSEDCVVQNPLLTKPSPRKSCMKSVVAFEVWAFAQSLWKEKSLSFSSSWASNWDTLFWYFFAVAFSSKNSSPTNRFRDTAHWTLIFDERW